MGYLLFGVMSAIFSATTTLMLGHGLLIAVMSYTLGGVAGIGVLLVVALLWRPRRATYTDAIQS